MRTIEKELVIARPIDEVFDFVADAGNEPRYNPNLVGAEQLTPGPIGPGTRFRLEGRVLGRGVETVYEVTAYDRPQRLVSRTIRAPLGLAIEGTVTFAPAPGGTKVRWSQEVTPHGVFALLAPLTVGALERRLDGAFANLKRLMETENGGR